MKTFLIVILFFPLTVTAFGQNLPDSGFTNKAEAKNEFNNYKQKQGKWVIYTWVDGDMIWHFTKDTSVTTYYSLTVYRAGVPVGISREYYYMNGKIKSETPYNVQI